LHFAETPFMKLPQAARERGWEFYALRYGIRFPALIISVSFCWFHDFHLELLAAILTVFYRSHRGRQI
jgi:hypothetical protein